MFIYIILLFFALLLLLIRNVFFNSISRLFIITIMVFSLGMIYIFRSDVVGTDYAMYHSLFYLPSNLLSSKFIEPGYIFINSIAQYNNNFLFISSVVFIIYILGSICLNNSLCINNFTFLSFFILTYMYCFSFNVIRQYLAIGIICIGLAMFFYYYHDNIIKYLFFFLSLFVANEFHSTAMFCAIFVIFPLLTITKNKVIVSSILTTALFFTNIVRTIFINLLNYFPNYVQKYSNSGALTSFGNKGLIQFLPIIIQFVFLYIYLYYNDNKDYKTKFILSGYLLFLIFYSGGGNTIVDRLQTYMYIFPILFACIFLDKKDNKTLEIYKYLFVLFWILYYLLRLITNNSGVVPYMFI